MAELACRWRLQRPAHHAPTEGIEHDGKKGELLLQTDIGDVRHPELIESRRYHAARAKALTFSPASIRRTTASLNSRLKTRGDDLDLDDLGLDIHSPIEKCPLFSVSHFWGALQLIPAFKEIDR